MMHTVGELSFPVGGIRWYGPGVGTGICAANPKYDWKVDSVLMQFTGLKDKNGKEIYEGDILECISDIVRLITNEKTGEIHRKICSVVYVPEKAHFTTQLPNGYIESGFGISQEIIGKWYEVIGNIYENPELLSNP